METTDPQMLMTLATLLLPGVIIDYCIRQTSSTNLNETGSYRIFYLAAFSMLNNLCWSDVIYYGSNQYVQYGLLILTSLVTGLVLARLNKATAFRWIAQKLKFTAKHPIPTAWEYMFGQSVMYLAVKLKNGEVYYGLYGPDSLAGDRLGYFDLFLEKIYQRDENGNWTPIENIGGLYIPHSEIQSIRVVK